MSTAEAILAALGAVLAALGSGGGGAWVYRAWLRRQERLEKTDLARLDLNGKTTPKLIEMLERAIAENEQIRDEYEQLRSDHRELRESLAANTAQTMEIADRVSPEVGQKVRSKLSDPKGWPAQREVVVHRDPINTERPYVAKPRPPRRTRDGE